MTTPANFARLLGITSDPDGFKAKEFTMEEDEDLMAFDSDLMELGKAKSQQFWSEFAASHLPQFVQSYCNRSFKSNSVMSIGLIQYSNWIGELVLNASTFPHFGRTREASTFALWMNVTEKISLLNDRELKTPFDVDNEDDDLPDALDQFDVLLNLWGQLQSSILGFLPSGSILPSPDSATSARLRARFPSFLLSKPRWNADGDEFLCRHFENLVAYYEEVIVAGSILRMDSELREAWLNGSNTQWWSCQALVDQTVGRKNPCSAGTRMDNREKMMACSRCLSVRYCSTEHQKIHWKTHKKVCFRPLW